MTRSLLRALTMLAVCLMPTVPAVAQFGQGNSSNNLFQQYDVGGAGVYPAPYYSPQLGAQSYYTYQPLMPHEMMYQHSRNYYNYYNTGGYFGGGNALNKTSVRWQSGTNHMGPLPFSAGLESFRYRVNKRAYSIEDGSERRGRLRGGLRGQRGAGLLKGGCSSGNCGGEVVGDEAITDTFVGEAIVSEGACSGGGCASRIRGALHR